MHTLENLKKYLHEKYSPKSAPGYLNTIKRYINYMKEKAITASYTDVLAYIGHLRKLNLQPRNIASHLFCIKVYYRWLCITQQRNDHPCRHLYLQDQINKRIPVENLYSKQTLEELLQNHRTKNKIALVQKRNEILISLLIYQALTIQEITTLNITDIDLQQATIKAKGGYKQKPRILSLQANQILLLHHYMTKDRQKILQYNNRLTIDDESALILGNTGNRIHPSSINKLINSGRAKQDQLKPFRIRQSVIAHLLKSNHDLRIVQVFAGHRNVDSTEQYKQTGLEELKTIIQKLHPLETNNNGSPAA